MKDCNLMISGKYEKLRRLLLKPLYVDWIFVAACSRTMRSLHLEGVEADILVPDAPSWHSDSFKTAKTLAQASGIILDDTLVVVITTVISCGELRSEVIGLSIATSRHVSS